MPGIVGLITKMPRQRAAEELLCMGKTLCHETFYVAGTWIDEPLGVYVGWAERKGSFSQGMPLRNEGANRVLVFSGEEFPEPGIRRDLKARNHKFDEDGASYLVHLSEEDPSFPKHLNGRFHGLLTDSNLGSAILFNDRYGMHRLYYHESKEAFYFAAEAKAILAVCPETRELNSRALAEFVSCSCTLEGRSLFEGIHIMPSGSRWSFCGGRLIKKEAYFKPEEWEGQEPLEPNEYYRKFRDVFARNLPRYFESAERVAMSLTGGLDTRIIMAWQRSAPGSLPCYTFGGMLRDSQDVVVGRQVAAACGQLHETVPVTEEFLARFPYYAERTIYLSDGCVDVSIAPDLYLHERARGIAPVRMTGLYGSEVLRRVCTFKPEQPLPDLFAPEILNQFPSINGTYAHVRGGHPVSFAAFRQAPWSQYGILALEQTQCAVRTPFLDNDLVRVAFQAPQSPDISTRLIEEGNRSLARIRTDRGLGRSNGRLYEAVSRALFEFLFKAEYAYDMGMPQWLAGADHALHRFHLERLFLGRHKIYHFRMWYRGAFSRYVREMLLDSRTLTRPFFRRHGLEAIVEGHLKGIRNYTNQIHKVITLELLHRTFVDAGSFRMGPAGSNWETDNLLNHVQGMSLT
jgi:asparagine synthase (glutamine-hydrolysing)